ncbi:MAG: hypothetical protein KKB90_05560 [Actinobacteria bacterium]|nr:hypothetical protein [Actinomycetota bacterium]MCG2818172.1 DUF5719 family protein [Actinomycetes bacterium]MBU4218414.1 hypothetical protein [Actinomycetota bacterium]MBU4358495.1 hypothetical protein [Actinomycetota bacterium]MBU4393072.1 hypothetical protein [Actinomycetota bacterium]
MYRSDSDNRRDVFRWMCALLILSLALLMLPAPLLAEAPADNRVSVAESGERAEWTEEGKEWYLAEGCTAGGFETWVLIQNPGEEEADVTLTFQGVEGLHRGPELKLPPGHRTTVNVAETCPDLWDVSTKITSSEPVISERAMYWNNRTGGHNSVGATSPSRVWYLAEGCTAGGFETWVLIQNPGEEEASVTLSYLGPDGSHPGPTISLPPGSRRSVNVADNSPGWWEISTKVTSDKPVIAARSMYWNGREGGHSSPGVTTPQEEWYLAEGCTEGGFETWVLIQNPGEEEAGVTLSFQGVEGLHTGPELKIPPGHRTTINVAETCPDWWDVSTKVVSDKPVIAERSMYFNERTGGHNSAGVTTPQEEWYLAEGCTAGGFETWVLMQNPGEEEASVTLSYLGPDGSHPGPTLSLPPGSRRSVNIADNSPGLWEISTKVTSDKPVIAERSTYWNGRSGGHNSPGRQRGETVIPDTTKVLNSSTLAELESVSSGGGTLTFKKSTGQLDSLLKGDVIVCGVTDNTPYGLLRKVTSKKTQGGKVIVDTEDGFLEEAVNRGTLNVEQNLNSDDLVSATALVDGVHIEDGGNSGGGLKFTVSEDIDLDGAKLSGSVTFEQEFDLNARIDFNPLRPWDPPSLEEMTFTTTTKEEANLKLSGEVPIEVKAEKEIVRYNFAPIIVPGLPVVVIPTVTVKLGANGKVSANMETNVTQKAEVTAGLSYTGGLWNTISGHKSEFSFDSPTLSADKASAKAYVKPQLSLLLYGIVGPYAGIEGYLSMYANPDANPWWRLYGGLKGDVGVELRVFSKVIASYSETVFDWKQVLAQAEGGEDDTGRIYWDGTELFPFNSGFTGDGGTSRSKVSPPEGHLYLHANSWYLSGCQVAWSTDDAVDLSGYDRLCVEWCNTGKSNGNNESHLIAATNSHDRQENQSTTDKLTRTSSFDRRVDHLDVSHINEPRYIRVHARDNDWWDAGTNSKLYVYRVWLEPVNR